ncbi:MAG: Pathogenesis-related transcriptional factor and ERF protein [Hymenobacteraceae bacterium]|nr:Pathogenesis-related transcriptional factor and ERF protein [Hymenobacteraceae bacterium]MDX5397851.1 Pathogenesis-related transcriptional factor and ERF protein [Hymenobacteraceae bacterium]MDX5444209.1 Pathogenesis-related transcriptional factor and ERF protein [Hymenobacteraceae bacterium]MDX5513923.1 Pathogenesis-related transcriptional factor and ERF protein [Hymenobacteraceae bacterium]
MLYKLKLKNSDKQALIDDSAFDFLNSLEYLQHIEFFKNLRIHSRGYAFFQKNWPQRDGTYKNETIYLHKIIAEKLIPKPEDFDTVKYCVSFKNANRLDCRLENLEWATLSKVGRNTSKTDNKLGYRGVYQEFNKFRAILYYNKQRFNLGVYETVEEAAEAYNKKSIELFGKTKSLNKIEKTDKVEVEENAAE